MTDQPTLFDAAASREARDAGIAQVSEGKAEWLERVREWALWRIGTNGYVTADDLRARFELPDGAHVNTWGACFKDRRFKLLAFTPSKNIKRHANRIGKWGRA